MVSIVIALPKIEIARQIRDILIRHGVETAAVTTTGAGALAAVSQLSAGIVISGPRLGDMYYMQLKNSLPDGFEILLLGPGGQRSGYCTDIIYVETPVRASGLVNTVQMMLEQMERRLRKKKKSGPKPRSEKEENYIRNAKWLLMEQNQMTEPEAYRYLQKCSMDSGTGIVETAQMVLTLMLSE